MSRKYKPLDVEPKKLLGRGGYKVCYTVAGRRNLVVLIHEESILDLDESFALIEEERRHLAALRNLGLPVVEIGDVGTIQYNGTRCAAFTMPRYACGNRETGYMRFVKVLNERTLNDARRLLSQFERAQPLFVDDLQFLFGRDGSVHIADPLWVERRYSTTHRHPLDQIVRAARYCLNVRRSGKTPRSRCIWQAAEDWSLGLSGK